VGRDQAGSARCRSFAFRGATDSWSARDDFLGLDFRGTESQTQRAEAGKRLQLAARSNFGLLGRGRWRSPFKQFTVSRWGAGYRGFETSRRVTPSVVASKQQGRSYPPRVVCGLRGLKTGTFAPERATSTILFDRQIPGR